MAKQYEIITLLDSDDDQDSKVEATATVGNGVKSQKSTARKSVRSGMTVTSVKSEPNPMVSQPSVIDSKNANQPSSNSTENLNLPHKTARKSLNTSNRPPTTKLVTSPKLSLKRKQIENPQTFPEKKLKVDSAAQNTKTIPLPFEKKNNVHSDLQTDLKKVIPSPYVPNGIPTDAAQQADPNKVIPLPFAQSKNSTPTEAAQQVDPNKAIPLPYVTSTNSSPAQPSASCKQNNIKENSVPWNASDDNATKFKKLLDFSKTYMTATTTEKCKIVKNFHKLLDKASPVYINSAEFDVLLNDTVAKIKDSKDTFVHLQTIKTELKAYKRKKESELSFSSSHQSSSPERSDATKLTSNLGHSPSKPPKEVPDPIRPEDLASAILCATSNLNSHKHSNNSYPLSNVPSTSQQADIVESFRLSMPESNARTPPNDSRNIPSAPKRPNTTDNLNSFLPVISNATSTSDLKNIQSTSKQNDMLLDLNNKTPGQDKLGAPDQAFNTLQVPILNNPSALSANDIFHKRAMDNENLLDNKNTILISDQQSLYQESSTVNRIRDGAKLQEKSLNSPKEKPAASSKNLESKEMKFEKRVKFLENYLEKLHKKIKKLQSKELSLDDLDDEDSTYILEDRYKKKLAKTWATLCKIKKRSPLVGREIDKRFHYQGSRHDAINKSIEKLINKRKVTEKFPNYVEVLNLIRKVSDETHISLSSGEIENEARDAFQNIGIELKRRRKADEENDFGCYLTDNLNLEPDPADVDEELNAKLKCSVAEGEKKIKEIIDKYASEQKEKKPGEESEEEEGSDCEEPLNDEPTEEDAHNNLLDNENPVDLDNLPDTAPATPETDERAESPEMTHLPTLTVPPPPDDVIDIGSSSDASTDPGGSVAQLPNTTFIPSERIFINDDIEIVEDNQQNDSGSSPELPSISELCR